MKLNEKEWIQYSITPWPRPGLSVVEHPTKESHQGGQVRPIIERSEVS
ncbi:MAG: hypothetical protein GQ554_07460 [Deltaproteobacteria bacterium]|nr:hypothetical protein [Deltaproteobacteria bacterium]